MSVPENEDRYDHSTILGHLEILSLGETVRYVHLMLLAAFQKCVRFLYIQECWRLSLLAPASSPLNVPIHGVQWSEKVGVLLSGRPAAFDPNGQDSDTAFTP